MSARVVGIDAVAYGQLVPAENLMLRIVLEPFVAIPDFHLRKCNAGKGCHFVAGSVAQTDVADCFPPLFEESGSQVGKHLALLIAQEQGRLQP